MRPPPMLVAATAAWSAAAAGTLLLVPLTAACAVVAAAVAVAVAVAGGRRRGVLAAIGVGVALAATSAALHVRSLHSSPLARLAAHHAAVDVVARLVRDPQPADTASGASLTIVDATVVELLGAHPRRLATPVLLLSFDPGWSGLLPGQRVEITGRSEPARPHDDVAAVIDVRGTPRLLGVPSWEERAAGHVRAALLAASSGLPRDPRGLLPGLVDGDTSRVPGKLQDDMRATGLTHLEAVSGENLTIVLGVAMAVVRAAGIRRRGRVVLAGFVVLGFVWLARPSPSVLRAAVMSAVSLLAMFTGRRASAMPTLALAVLVLVVVDPFLARSVGFVLSVVATAGIVVIAPAWTRRLERSMPRPVAVSLAVPAAAQLACTPVLLLAFGQLTPYAVAANLLAAPAVAPATVLGLAGAAVASASVPLARPVVWFAAVPTAAVAWTAHGFAALPGAAVVVSRPVAAVLAVGVSAWLWRIVKRGLRTSSREIL
ncbi:MAG TPA: ComEC/Rec2 family competence protein [Mycobacteriales bacterium]|nr:ComEC/Rec2 family competence protein [Mycobacteriales bacterium]